MSNITTRGIIVLMVNQVGVATARDFADQCSQIGMVTRSSPERDLALSMSNNNLPPYERQFHFFLNLDGESETLFEILEKDGLILQAGYQCILPSRMILPSRAKRKYTEATQVLEHHYGTGLPMSQPSLQILNYGNAATVAYAAIQKTGKYESLTVRVGNRCFWQ